MDVEEKGADFKETLDWIFDLVEDSVITAKDAMSVYRDYVEIQRLMVEIEHEKVFVDADKMGIAASPLAFWLEVLRNTRRAGGFSGYVSNGSGTVEQQALGLGISAEQLLAVMVAPVQLAGEAVTITGGAVAGLLDWAQTNSLASLLFAPEIVAYKWATGKP